MRKGPKLSVSVRNPIEELTTDVRKLKMIFKHFPMLPWAGYRDKPKDGLLAVLYDMYDLSPTHGSCINSINDYVIGDGILISKITDEYINLEDNPVDETTKKLFSETLKGKTPKNLHELASDLSMDYSKTGNYYIRLVLMESLGVRDFKLEVVLQKNTRLGLDANGMIVEECVISPNIVDDTYLKEHKPEIIAAYPNFTKTSRGLETIIHEKEGVLPYGRPDWLGSLQNQYSEFQTNDTRLKLSQNEFLPRVLLEMEQGDPNHNKGLDVYDYENNFTNKSDDPLMAWVSTRPHGAAPMTVVQVKPTSNENYYKVVSEIDEDKIIASHRWSKRLLGQQVSSGLAGFDLMTELLTKKTMIDKRRNKIAYGLNTAIAKGIEFLEIKELEGIGVWFYSRLLDSSALMDITNKNNSTDVDVA